MNKKAKQAVILGMMQGLNGKCVTLAVKQANQGGTSIIGVGQLYHSAYDMWKVKFVRTSVYFHIDAVSNMRVDTSYVPSATLVLEYMEPIV